MEENTEQREVKCITEDEKALERALSEEDGGRNVFEAIRDEGHKVEGFKRKLQRWSNAESLAMMEKLLEVESNDESMTSYGYQDLSAQMLQLGHHRAPEECQKQLFRIGRIFNTIRRCGLHEELRDSSLLNLLLARCNQDCGRDPLRHAKTVRLKDGKSERILDKDKHQRVPEHAKKIPQVPNTVFVTGDAIMQKADYRNPRLDEKDNQSNDLRRVCTPQSSCTNACYGSFSNLRIENIDLVKELVRDMLVKEDVYREEKRKILAADSTEQKSKVWDSLTATRDTAITEFLEKMSKLLDVPKCSAVVSLDNIDVLEEESNQFDTNQENVIDSYLEIFQEELDEELGRNSADDRKRVPNGALELHNVALVEEKESHM